MWRRNVIEYAVGAALIIVFAAAAVVAATPLARIGCALVAAGVAVVLWQLYAQARAASPQELAATESWAAFYRRELVRQRDALKRVWLWYLGPLVPGMVVYWLSVGVQGGDALWGWLVTASGLGVTCIVFAAVAAANARAARALQAEIEALDTACKS